MQRVFQLLFRHPRTTLDAFRLRPLVERFPRRLCAVVSARVGRPAAALFHAGGVFAAHRGGALAAARGADVGFALGFLLVGLAFGLLALGFGERFLVLLLALIFGGAGLVQCDRDRLLAVLHFTGLAFRATLQLAMREFMHDSTDDFFLLWRFLGHGWTPLFSDKTCNGLDLFRKVICGRNICAVG